MIEPLQMSPASETFPRYDSIQDKDSGYRGDIRNLENLFRGISILALFIGLISFFFGLSHVFDDLFILCQIIFVHIFIQSPWLAVTMKVPLSGMHLVQFMAWLPLQGRIGLERAIIPPNHYQRSPIVYEQYWKDITFARTIYNVVLFLLAMLGLFILIRVINSLRRPKIHQIADNDYKKRNFVDNFYYEYVRRVFTYLDKVVRFSFFTVIWACNLQFIYFWNTPRPFFIWNSALCIVMFVAFVLYPVFGYCYLRNEASTLNESTFFEKHKGIRIRREKLWYFLLQYVKWLVIAILIAQLYEANPLAPLIPLIFIHILDTVIISVSKPYLLDSGERNRIVSKCTKYFWKYYWISFIIQNILFVLLEVVMIIMYGIRGYASKGSYLSTGYACCAFIIMLLVNGLIRLAWGFIRSGEVCIEDCRVRDLEVKSEDDVSPLRYIINTA